MKAKDHELRKMWEFGDKILTYIEEAEKRGEERIKLDVNAKLEIFIYKYEN